MKRTIKWLGYALFAIVILFSSIYYLFPSELIVNYIQNSIKEMNPEYQVSVREASLKIPPGLKLKDVDLYHKNLLMFKANDIILKPELWSLLNEKRTVWFQIKAYQGLLSGMAEIDAQNTVNEPSINADFSGLSIKDISAFNRMTKIGLSGFLSGRISFKAQEGRKQRIDANIHISEGTVELPVPILNLGNLSFKSIDADIMIRNNKLELIDCVFKGNEVDVTLAGNGVIQKAFENTRIDLTGIIELTPLMKNDKTKGNYSGVSSRIKKYKNGIPIRIGGTLGNPEFSLKL